MSNETESEDGRPGAEDTPDAAPDATAAPEAAAGAPEAADAAEATDPREGVAEVIDLAEARSHLPEGEADEAEDAGTVPTDQLEPLIECLMFASERPLSMADLKRLTGEKDSRLIGEALEALIERRQDAGIQVIGVAGGYCLRTNPAFAPWVSKLLAAKPVRLSRAMLETLAIVAYRQPITRPEMDEIRGVDCGPVLKTLLDRGLIRIIGKKEEVGRPILYGTTPEFLRVFSLKDLTELPTLRQFHELSAEHQAKVAAKHGDSVADEATAPVIDGASLLGGGGELPAAVLAAATIAPDPEDDDGLLDELEEASELAARAAGPLNPEEPAAEPADGPK